jgi:hypothetical protein
MGQIRPIEDEMLTSGNFASKQNSLDRRLRYKKYQKLGN